MRSRGKPVSRKKKTEKELQAGKMKKPQAASCKPQGGKSKKPQAASCKPQGGRSFKPQE